MEKLWHDLAWDQYLEWQGLDRRTLKRINALITSIERNGYDCISTFSARPVRSSITSIERNGYDCIGKPEPLTGNLSGWWSVRIDEKNRLVFVIQDGKLIIHSCRDHY